jgi:hypothetical protein
LRENAVAPLERLGCALALCLGIGCSSQINGGLDMAAPLVLELDAMGSSYQSYQPAQLHAALGTPTQTTFGFMVSNGTGSISVIGRIAPADLGSENVHLSVTNGPLGDGLANAQVSGVTEVPALEDAVVQLHFAPNTVSGTLTPVASAPWTLTGELSVECSVPPATLPPSERPTGGIDGAGALSTDAAFTTPACAPLRALAGR